MRELCDNVDHQETYLKPTTNKKKSSTDIIIRLVFKEMHAFELSGMNFEFPNHLKEVSLFDFIRGEYVRDEVQSRYTMLTGDVGLGPQA